ncbi:hypothetical protein BDQ12DRAFT_380009 [Crucibulum laeve]|uniref:Uncharacterized protein n=1 Tax=Crucibulum laeve TaxID=68775 RepID=A0A5C3LN52_9AGAR|nr:hypothetical protein BDQ12DRAFT_380009 [Crucibulum laeve]
MLLIVQLFWVCENRGFAWKNLPVPQCNLPKQVAICLLVYIIADSILILSIIQLFLVIQDKRLRYRLIAMFSSSIVTSIVSSIHALFILQCKGPEIIIAALVEGQSPSLFRIFLLLLQLSFVWAVIQLRIEVLCFLFQFSSCISHRHPPLQIPPLLFLLWMK